ncbi:hypothetical protein TRVL_01317 [Trypanosoma vivax]|uniref:LicD/FKTN/FKRP nucleotidyltransferase domain-containing protein n=1 Tax=Trypanosoma vivax (strain Y486) TaxID=1055687 RepID=G0TVB3_TRYVY|nr:hypothetical protein TRVL_01317 [Trypanosoma vivax]CCC47879.1 conserved hypothetical protein [Trypanosoma vivax Y486]
MSGRRLLFHMTIARAKTPWRWFPTADENRLVERLDASGAPAQLFYAQLVGQRMCPYSAVRDVTISVCDFLDELLPRTEESYTLRCHIDRSRLMKNLIVTPEARIRMFSLLRDVLEVLHMSGIECWAAGGTLLGAVRQGSIIPWDDDVDLAVSVKDEAKLRAAFSYPGVQGDGEVDRNLGERNDAGCHLVLEFVPLFGYKVYSRLYPPPLAVGTNYCLRYGYFIDIFLTTEVEGRIILYRKGARQTWPNEWWHRDELFPLKCVPFASVVTCERGQSEHLRSTLSLPVGRSPLPHLLRLYGATCMEEAVIPCELHGRRLSHSLFIPVQLM